mmetsp:Transcript_105219/g.241185  ORF Transcript_105219/g.241185 Transcript_105219/m.241185 type:complete len:307 (+) Transcript_105219:711-1631(+)
MAPASGHWQVVARSLAKRPGALPWGSPTAGASPRSSRSGPPGPCNTAPTWAGAGRLVPDLGAQPAAGLPEKPCNGAMPRPRPQVGRRSPHPRLFQLLPRLPRASPDPPGWPEYSRKPCSGICTGCGCGGPASPPRRQCPCPRPSGSPRHWREQCGSPPRHRCDSPRAATGPQAQEPGCPKHLAADSAATVEAAADRVSPWAAPGEGRRWGAESEDPENLPPSHPKAGGCTGLRVQNQASHHQAPLAYPCQVPCPLFPCRPCPCPSSTHHPSSVVGTPFQPAGPEDLPCPAWGEWADQAAPRLALDS